MENKLKKLFEYQKFEQNERLAKLIAETEARQATEISDDDLEMVAAAGEITEISTEEKEINIGDDSFDVFE
ncbi:MAG: hypothetical protein MJZ90_12130 [Bacteroidales bacterium]|nr:hypothetical protein [Bacteroidales bacterium]